MAQTTRQKPEPRRVKVTVTTPDGEVLDSKLVELPNIHGVKITQLEVGCVLPDMEIPGYLERLVIGE